jgi:hypothetical protein
MIARWLVGLAATALLVSACGGDKAPPVTPTQAPTFVVPTRTPLASSKDATRTPFSILQDALLAEDDLPGEWVRGNFQLTGRTSVCGRPTDALKPETIIAQASASWGRGSGTSGTTLLHALVYLPEDEARRSLTIVREDQAACSEWTESAESGGAHWIQTAFEVRSVGDETLVTRATSKLPNGDEAHIAVAITRIGPLVSFLFAISGADLSDAEFDDILGVVIKKVEPAATLLAQ